MSANHGALSAHRPALRPDILLSPPLLRGPTTVHLVKDPSDGSCFAVGVREYFLISRLDGKRSTREIEVEYAAAFGRRLGDAHWHQLLTLLGSRRLLAGAEPPPASPSPASPFSGTLYRGSVRLVADADATTSKLHRALRPVLRAPALLVLLAFCLAMEVVLAADTADLARDTWWLFHQPMALLGVFTLLWLSTVGHELAHGVAARHLGGTVSEIGLRWRLPVAIMYCRVGNYRFLPRRRQQLAIGAAGAFANLLFLLPFAAWWALLEPADPTRRVLSGLLLLGSCQALVNLLPLPPLDGYTMLGHALRVDDYAPQSGHYLRLRLRDRHATAAYPDRARLLYTAYAIGSSVVVLVLAGVVATAACFLLVA
ncbi:putative peptide zinc metalloprotease protein [Streptomyces sp. T12]|uniref:peptidase M50 n=1 Tax=Streptomyces sp. T12 TaxID=477697 RepID=UPI00119F7B28|nr:peptidase M50 [Streptomyces sp. T12]TWD17657.1 putative peptide zinc metalloprotease protein [Streptomyces sp. T12]